MIEITDKMIEAWYDAYISTEADMIDGFRDDHRAGLEAAAPLIIAAYFKQYAGQQLPEPISAQLVSEGLDSAAVWRSDALQAVATLYAGRVRDDAAGFNALLTRAEQAAHWIETGQRK